MKILGATPAERLLIVNLIAAAKELDPYLWYLDDTKEAMEAREKFRAALEAIEERTKK
jgi:hypothetical protein